MEQRAHIRHSVDLTAMLSTQNAEKHSCRITDFCLGGVFTLFTGPERRTLVDMARGDPVAVMLEVSGRRGPREITLPAKVARVSADGLGLAFDQPNPTDLLALQNHVRSIREGQSASVSRTFSPERTLGVLEAVANSLKTFLIDRLESFFVEAADALTREADKAVSNEQQHPWFEAVEGLHQHAEDISRDFVQRAVRPLRDCMENPAAGEDWGQVQSRGSASRLSLVDKDLFEDWLTLKVMASRAEGRFHDELLPLQLRFDELLGLGVGARRNPLHPAVIASAFGDSLKRVPLKPKTDRTVLHAFEKVILDDLARLYRETNQAMARAGVLPDLDIGRYLAEHYGQANTETPTAGAEHADSEEESATPATSDSDARTSVTPPPPAGVSEASTAFASQHRIANQAYDTVKRLLSARRATVPRPGAGAAGNTVAAEAVVEIQTPAVSQALEELQRAANDPAQGPLPVRVKKAVGEESGGAPVALDGELEAATEVIHHLFEGIGSNPALSDKVRDAIRRLEVPFLRLLLQDEAFLHEEQHPARQMLNRIAHLGVRGNPNLARHEQEIDQHVQEILDNFSNDINIFENTLGDLDELASQQHRLYQRNISRVTEACEGRQKLVVARREVNQALERRIGGRRVPRALLALIDAGWRELLVQTLLRRGRDSREWHQYLRVLDQMQEAADTMPVQEDLSRLLSAIKSGLAQVDETQVKNPSLVGELRSLLSVKARNESGPPPRVEVPAGMVDAAQPAEEESLGERERRWRRRARRYEPGEWFEISDADEIQQTRLAWVNADKDLFVFVNHQGLRVQEYPLNEFARQLESGGIRAIDSLDAPAVDRGLEQMVQRVYDQMAHQATHDELTGLFNRREFQRRIRRRLQETDADKRATLVHFDVDQFKVVNNIGGPEAGDRMLCDLGALVHETLPGTMVARLGGDAFALWLEELNEEAAMRAVRSLCERVEKHRFQYGSQPHAVTLSCGLAHRQGPGDTADGLMQAAESACQTAKEAGRNRVHQYRADDEDMVRRDDVMVWVTRLNEALDNDRLELRCQKIEPTDGGDHPPSYEVLISIKTDSGELVPPAEFVQAAERYNRMHAVDRWVIGNVLRWMHANADLLENIDHISINLSGHSLNDTTMPEFLFEHFRRYPVPRNRLCFEVTETTAIANLEDAADFIRAMQDLGCRFSLDDFGSGLASYGYLKHLPVDFIKIDGSFIKDVATDPADLALVRSINEMGHLMGKKTIAEYVENDDIRRALLEIGVDFVQGYGVEKPRLLESLRDTATPA